MALHDEEWHTTAFAWGHARHRRKGFWNKEVEKSWKETQESVRMRLISCYNCPIKCGATISVPGMSTYMMKCYSKISYVMAAMVDDLAFGFRIAGLAQEYGVDGFTTPQVMALAVELYEAGILTDQDMPGFPSDKEGRFYWLLDRIVRREGIGDVLANGVYWAARQIGRGAESYDHNTIKKHEQVALKLGIVNPIYFLMHATGEKINITQIEGQIPQAPFATREEREEFVKDWIQVPNEKFKEFVLNWEPGTLPYYPTIQTTCELVDWQETMHYIDDCTGICAGLSSFPIKPPYHIHNYPAIISSATGIDMDEAGLSKAAKRNRTLLRAVNIRRGMRRTDEKPPEDHWKKRFPELEAKLLDEYYKFKGWSNQGIPTKESLHELGMDYVAEDLEERGIINNE
jgi:aldehyde:ferredoxin oxidoreductase